MEFELEDHEKVHMVPIAEKPVDSSLDSSESGASMKVIEFNEDGSVKQKKMKDHVLEMVDLKKPMNRLQLNPCPSDLAISKASPNILAKSCKIGR